VGKAPAKEYVSVYTPLDASPETKIGGNPEREERENSRASGNTPLGMGAVLFEVDCGNGGEKNSVYPPKEAFEVLWSVNVEREVPDVRVSEKTADVRGEADKIKDKVGGTLGDTLVSIRMT